MPTQGKIGAKFSHWLNFASSLLAHSTKPTYTCKSTQGAPCIRGFVEFSQPVLLARTKMRTVTRKSLTSSDKKEHQLVRILTKKLRRSRADQRALPLADMARRSTIIHNAAFFLFLENAREISFL